MSPRERRGSVMAPTRPWQPQGSRDGPRLWPGQAVAEGAAWGQRPQNLPGCPTGTHPTSGSAVPGALPAGTPSLPALRCCLLPTCQPLCHCPPVVCVSAPSSAGTGWQPPPSPFSPREGTPQKPPKEDSSPRGWNQTPQGSHWGDCGGDKDLAMLVTSTWRALSPPNSCIPPEPVWQGSVQVPRKRHPGWAFPGHALLHSSAE